MNDTIKYFLDAWEMNGVGTTVAEVQDSPGTVVTITVDDLRELLEAARRTVSGQEAIYQSEQMPGVWLDISKEEFDSTHHARIVYAAPIPAMEKK